MLTLDYGGLVMQKRYFFSHSFIDTDKNHRCLVAISVPSIRIIKVSGLGLITYHTRWKAITELLKTVISSVEPGTKSSEVWLAYDEKSSTKVDVLIVTTL